MTPMVATPAAAYTVAGGQFHTMQSQRLLDTRSAGPALAQTERSISVTALGIPSTASAVVIDVTVVGATARSDLRFWADGSSRPGTTNINFNAGELVSNAAIVGLNNGVFRMFNTSGSVHVIIDVQGWFGGLNDTSGAGAFSALDPQRLLDTRLDASAIAAYGVRTVNVAQLADINPSYLGAVAINLTVVGTASSGMAVVYRTGTMRPATSSIDFAASTTLANLVSVEPDSNGNVSIYNGSPSAVNILLDMQGWWTSAAVPGDGGEYSPVAPTRLLDTRTGVGGVSAAVAPGQTVKLPIAGTAGIPTTEVAAVYVNVVAVQATGSGHLQLFGAGMGEPDTSNVNFTAGYSRSAASVVPLGDDGAIEIHNGSSTVAVNVVIDVSGWFHTFWSDVPQCGFDQDCDSLTWTTDVASEQAALDASFNYTAPAEDLASAGPVETVGATEESEATAGFVAADTSGFVHRGWPSDYNEPTSSQAGWQGESSATVHIERYENGKLLGACTGFLYSVRDVGTAGHCVTTGSAREYADLFMIYPGQYRIGTRVYRPFGYCRAYRKATTRGWKDRGDLRHDRAAVRLDWCSQDPSGNIGRKTGYLGMTGSVQFAGLLGGKTATYYGYPSGDPLYKPYQSQWSGSGVIYRNSFYSFRMKTQIGKGASGGPAIVTTPAGNRVVVGIVSNMTNEHTYQDRTESSMKKISSYCVTAFRNFRDRA